MSIDIHAYWTNETGGCITEQLSTGPTQDVWCHSTGAIQKGNTVEVWQLVDHGIVQIGDTSPGPDAQGTPRYYLINHGDGTLWVPRYVDVGMSYHDGGHHVQFHAMSDCRTLPQNSGEASVTVAIISVGPRTFNAFGQNLTFNDVLTLNGNGETHYFGRGYGRLGWTIPGAFSEVVEIHQPGERTPPLANIPSCSGLIY